MTRCLVCDFPYTPSSERKNCSRCGTALPLLEPEQSDDLLHSALANSQPSRDEIQKPVSKIGKYQIQSLIPSSSLYSTAYRVQFEDCYYILYHFDRGTDDPKTDALFRDQFD